MGGGWKSFEVNARNMDIKGDSGEVSERNENMLLETEGKAILVIKQQRTWVNYFLMFCGGKNL